MHERRPVVVFSGGGTGGHLYPALALAQALRSLRPDVRVVFLGARRGIEARVLPERREEHRLVPIRGLARRRIVENLTLPWAVLRSLWSTWRWYRGLHPELVVVTGGYAGFPAGLLAPRMGVPLLLQEQNAFPGLTTRVLAPRAAEIHVAYPEAVPHLPEVARPNVRDTGNPVRPPAPQGVEAARRALGLDRSRPTVVVTGGSQGSRALNERVAGMVRTLSEDPGFQLLWATGPTHESTVRDALPSAPSWVHIRGYLDEMPLALESADVAIGRAGAMSTSEYLAWGIPAILVPLPTSAEGHQSTNAEALEAAGCALHLPEATLTGASLAEAVTGLLNDAPRRAAMKERALERARPDAAMEVARAMLRYLPDAEVQA